MAQGDERAQRAFARLADQNKGVDCGGADGSPGAPTAGGQPASCSYAAAQQPPAAASGESASSCPVPSSARTREVFSATTGLPTKLDVAPSSSGSSGGVDLNRRRQASTIPMAEPDEGDKPKHQPGDGSQVWMYPSEQMFFNAMHKKGWDPRADDMRAVVSIHNGVNERAWRDVMSWEGMHAGKCATPRLKRFRGRPADYSPKARLLNALGFALPFDRHDWVVDRCGREVRYVIDFYSGVPAGAMFLDVRPALDSFEAAWDRVKLQALWVASGRWLG